jgi:hypothetical protein
MIRPPLIPIELDKLRHLCLDLPALELAEERLTALEGQRVYIFEVLLDAKERMRMRNLRILIWAALRYEDPSVSDIEVGTWLHLGNMSEVMRALEQCIVASQPDAEPTTNGNGGGQPPDPQPAESIGSASGPLDASSSALLTTISEA